LQYAGRVASVVNPGADGAGDGTEQTGDVGDVLAWRTEVRVVQRIESIRTELQAYSFGDWESFPQSQIQVEIPGATQVVARTDRKASVIKQTIVVGCETFPVSVVL
jgi:hypothetical protein